MRPCLDKIIARLMHDHGGGEGIQLMDPLLSRFFYPVFFPVFFFFRCCIIFKLFSIVSKREDPRGQWNLNRVFKKRDASNGRCEKKEGRKKEREKQNAD